MSQKLFLAAFALACGACCIVSGFAHAQQRPPKMEDPEPPDDLKTTENGWIAGHKLDPSVAKAFKSDPNDSPLRKLQKDRCRELSSYIAKIETLIEIGKWNPQDFSEYLKICASLSESLLEIVDIPKDKLKCLELCVEILRVGEKFTETRVAVGSDPSQNLNVARAARINAEILVLKLKTEIDKSDSISAGRSVAPMGTPSGYQFGTPYRYQPPQSFPTARWSPSTGWTYPGVTGAPITGWSNPAVHPIPGRIFLGGGG
jgi:hypothetical protein